MATQGLVFYTAKGSPFSQRVEIVFEEAGVHPTTYFIDVRDKPGWFVEKVNPVGKIPAATYGGPTVALDDPSSESVKLAESLVLLEFAAELYPNANMYPKDIVDRARARFFISATSELLTSFYGLIVKGTTSDAILKDLKTLQKLLPPGSGFAVGDFSIADAAVAPFIGRLEVYLRNDLGMFAAGEGPKMYKEIFESAEFARLQQYWKDVVARPSFKATFDEPFLVEYASAYLTKAKAQK
ncbi:hypothetical protein EVG20_g3005 [Dentipellis fragilis]|uniref:GST N-terminal domain-containing protein n=1 Tax=Dentipellis fragilis TaxID=205917 RepID=A0A4Y9Z6X9_9AGAM|nr:hypothetical protein EVG20_g3005 [Dentipellis fragilis]